MTKIGEEGIPPKPSQELYQKNLQEQIYQFNRNLDAYQMASNPKELAELKNLMNQQIELIRSAVSEIKRSGADKQAEKVRGDYERFSKDPTDQNYTALQQDMATLKEYSQLPLDRKQH